MNLFALCLGTWEGRALILIQPEAHSSQLVCKSTGVYGMSLEAAPMPHAALAGESSPGKGRAAKHSICPQKSCALVLVLRQRPKIDHLTEKGWSILVHKFRNLRPQSLGLIALGLWQTVLKACLLHDRQRSKERDTQEGVRVPVISSRARP